MPLKQILHSHWSMRISLLTRRGDKNFSKWFANKVDTVDGKKVDAKVRILLFALGFALLHKERPPRPTQAFMIVAR